MNNYLEERETEYKNAKHLMSFRMNSPEKYYYAFQCALFAKTDGIQFHKHSISLGNQYSYDLKRFNNKDEMLGFVIGYNEAILNIKINEVA